MNKFVLSLFIAWQLLSSIESTNNNNNNTIQINYKTVKLNDILDLECSQSRENKTTILGNATGLNGFDIFIFKKDNVLVNLFRTKLRVKISSLADQGAYECGYYRFDKHGTLDYFYQNTWSVNITMPENIPLRYASSKNADNQHDVIMSKKISFNILTQNPIKITIIGVLLLAVLFTVFLLLNKDNMPINKNSCVKLPPEDNTALFNCI